MQLKLNRNFPLLLWQCIWSWIHQFTDAIFINLCSSTCMPNIEGSPHKKGKRERSADCLLSLNQLQRNRDVLNWNIPIWPWDYHESWMGISRSYLEAVMEGEWECKILTFLWTGEIAWEWEFPALTLRLLWKLHGNFPLTFKLWWKLISWFDMWFNIVKPRFLFKTVDLWSYINT